MKPSPRTRVGAVLILGMMLALGGAAAVPAAPAAEAPATFPCVSQDRLEKDVTPEASLESLACYFARWEGADTLHFKVTLENVCAEPRRFRVNIFLDNGKAVGGLIPRKAKGGLVEPGASASFVYPVQGMPGKPGSMLLRIRTVQP